MTIPPDMQASKVANVNDTDDHEDADDLPLDEAVPMSTNAALALLFGATVAFGFGVLALMPGI